MTCTTRGRTTRSTARFPARSGFTLIELVITLVLMLLLLGGYVRAFDDAEEMDEFMRGDDIVRHARSMIILKVLEETAVTTAPETASDDGEAHPVGSAALPQENGDIVVLPPSDVAGDHAAAPR